MHTCYILVSDGCRAKLFRTQGPLRPASRLELVLEQMSWQKSRPGVGESFVQALCHTLGQARRAGDFQALYLSGPAELLDAMRARMSAECQLLLRNALPFNLLQHSEGQIVGRLLECAAGPLQAEQSAEYPGMR